MTTINIYPEWKHYPNKVKSVKYTRITLSNEMANQTVNDIPTMYTQLPVLKKSRRITTLAEVENNLLNSL